MIQRYKDPSGPLKPARVLIDGEWVELKSNGDGTLSAGNKQFKVNTKPTSVTGDKEIVVTPNGNREVDKEELKTKVGYSSAFNGRDIMVPVKKGFELLGQGLYAGAQGIERQLTYNPLGLNPIGPAINYNSSTPVTNAIFRYGLPYLQPSKVGGTIKSGFKYLPHDPRNPGLFGDEDLNLMFDIGTTPAFFKGTKTAIKATPKVSGYLLDTGLEVASDLGSNTARNLRIAREINKATSQAPVAKSNSLAHLQRPDSNLTLAERVGVPKGERAAWDPQVMKNAIEFAQKYGYEIPKDLEAAKNMYRQHNTFFRTVNMEQFKPDPYDDGIVIPGFEESHAAPSGIDLYPELKGLSDQQLKYQVATKGYPTTIISRKPGEPLFNNQFVFVAPDFGFTKMFNQWNPFENTVTVRRPFSFGNPLDWHKNADWRPIRALDSEVPYTKGEARLGNWGPEKEVKLSTEHLYPVKMTSPQDKGSLVGEYLKEQNVVTEPSTSFEFYGNENLPAERVNYSKYSIDAENPQERAITMESWKNRYPNSRISFYQEPIKTTAGFSGEEILKVGEMPLSNKGMAIADMMTRRMQKYPFREGLDPNVVVGEGGRISTKGIAGYMDKLKQQLTYLYMPLSRMGNMEGFSFAGVPYLKLNPWRSKPYQFTQIHEGLSHPTDAVVKEMRTPSGQRLLGHLYKDSSGNTHAEGAYGKVSYPEDLYEPKIIDEILHRDSKKPIESRAINWEMITELVNQLAKEKGITFEEATKLPEAEFNSFVANKLRTPEELSQFMKKFNNQYLNDYAKLLEQGNSKQQNAYGNRIIKMIQKAPLYSLPLGGYTLYNLLNNNQYKQGGKMNKIDFAKSGIHIKKKNRGKFTEYCGGKVTDSCIRRAKASGNPTLVKRATFAANARKWHKFGGIINSLPKYQEGGLLISSYKMPQLSPVKVYLPEDDTEDKIKVPDFSITSNDDTQNIVLPTFSNLTSFSSNSTSSTTQSVSSQAKEGDQDKTIVQILEEEGIKHRVSSAFRPNAQTTSGKPSNHSKKDAKGNPGAYDIQPLDGDIDRFRKELYGNPRVVAWLKSHNWGIIEEIAHQANGDSGYWDPDTGVFKKTGYKQGNHFHFGPDIAGVKTSKKYMSYA